MLLGDAAETKIRGGAVRRVLATSCTSVSITVRLEEERERREGNLLSINSFYQQFETQTMKTITQ